MDTQAVLTLLQQAAETYINPRFEALASHEVIEKNPGDLVTVADREAEVFITAELQKAYPDALIVGEEAVAADPSILDRIESADHWFTVDPIGSGRCCRGRRTIISTAGSTISPRRKSCCSTR